MEYVEIQDFCFFILGILGVFTGSQRSVRRLENFLEVVRVFVTGHGMRGLLAGSLSKRG